MVFQPSRRPALRWHLGGRREIKQISLKANHRRVDPHVRGIRYTLVPNRGVPQFTSSCPFDRGSFRLASSDASSFSDRRNLFFLQKTDSQTKSFLLCSDGNEYNSSLRGSGIVGPQTTSNNCRLGRNGRRLFHLTRLAT